MYRNDPLQSSAGAVTPDAKAETPAFDEEKSIKFLKLVQAGKWAEARSMTLIPTVNLNQMVLSGPDQGKTALWFALKLYSQSQSTQINRDLVEQHFKFIQWLLIRGAEVNAIVTGDGPHQGMTPFLYANICGLWNVVVQILQLAQKSRISVNVNVAGAKHQNAGKTALYFALMAISSSNASLRDVNEKSPFAMLGHQQTIIECNQVVGLLLEQKAEINARPQEEESSGTPLIMAIAQGLFENALKLLEAPTASNNIDAYLDGPDRVGKTALWVATADYLRVRKVPKQGKLCLAIIEKLLSLHANPYIETTGGLTPLFVASYCPKLLLLILQKSPCSPNINACAQEDPFADLTILRLAMQNLASVKYLKEMLPELKIWRKIIKELIDKGADPHQLYDERSKSIFPSALYQAIQMEDAELALEFMARPSSHNLFSIFDEDIPYNNLSLLRLTMEKVSGIRLQNKAYEPSINGNKDETTWLMLIDKLIARDINMQNGKAISIAREFGLNDITRKIQEASGLPLDVLPPAMETVTDTPQPVQESSHIMERLLRRPRKNPNHKDKIKLTPAEYEQKKQAQFFRKLQSQNDIEKQRAIRKIRQQEALQLAKVQAEHDAKCQAELAEQEKRELEEQSRLETLENEQDRLHASALSQERIALKAQERLRKADQRLQEKARKHFIDLFLNIKWFHTQATSIINMLDQRQGSSIIKRSKQSAEKFRQKTRLLLAILSKETGDAPAESKDEPIEDFAALTVKWNDFVDGYKPFANCPVIFSKMNDELQRSLPGFFIDFGIYNRDEIIYDELCRLCPNAKIIIYGTRVSSMLRRNKRKGTKQPPSNDYDIIICPNDDTASLDLMTEVQKAISTSPLFYPMEFNPKDQADRSKFGAFLCMLKIPTQAKDFYCELDVKVSIMKTQTLDHGNNIGSVFLNYRTGEIFCHPNKQGSAYQQICQGLVVANTPITSATLPAMSASTIAFHIRTQMKHEDFPELTASLKQPIQSINYYALINAAIKKLMLNQNLDLGRLFRLSVLYDFAPWGVCVKDSNRNIKFVPVDYSYASQISELWSKSISVYMIGHKYKQIYFTTLLYFLLYKNIDYRKPISDKVQAILPQFAVEIIDAMNYLLRKETNSLAPSHEITLLDRLFDEFNLNSLLATRDVSTTQILTHSSLFFSNKVMPQEQVSTAMPMQADAVTRSSYERQQNSLEKGVGVGYLPFT